MSTVQAMGSPGEPQVLALPDDLALNYVAEGAANVIWRIAPPQTKPSTPPTSSVEEYSASTPPPSEIDIPATNGDAPLTYNGVLLRLRKCLPSSESNLLAYEYLSTVIMPLFPPGVMVGQTLVRVPPGLISRANDILHHREEAGLRPAHRWNLYLAGDPRPTEQQMEEPYAFLLEDMTPDVSRGELLLEFKAKWLSQSPNAPSDWKRCRTCALRLQKAAKALAKGKPAEWRGLCPLDLVSGHIERAKNAVRHILGRSRCSNEILVQRVTNALVSSPQLAVLKELQASLDPTGILEADHQSKEFLTAMTLRDCTFFVKVTPSDIQARLGDFDVKSGEGGKSAYWIETERALIDGGWYSGTEAGNFPWKEKKSEVFCQD
ncbi:hypothetical protein ABW21_db0201463 [Orbilia brochopaga]|nr:hypothetical protein ABW21_db0201463 [Drechslerella brochopaga]